MAFTQSDLDALDTAIKSGVLEVRFQDRMERFNSVKDMLVARTLLVSQINPPGTAPGIRRQIRMITGNGW
jgi:hypothetical protein